MNNLDLSTLGVEELSYHDVEATEGGSLLLIAGMIVVGLVLSTQDAK
jgi:hypothetical protein